MIDVEAARAVTPGCTQRVHLDHAGSSLMPQPVLDVVIDHLRVEALVGGYSAAAAAAERIDAVYGSIAALIGCQAHEVALVENATRAWDMAFYSLPLGEGDRILTSHAEYESNAMAIAQVSRQRRTEVVVLPDDSDGQLSLDALDHELAHPRTRLVALTHVPTSSGLVNPVAEVGRRCREAGVPFLLDACQSVGQLRVDVDEIGCDLLSATGRKFLRGPRGTAFLYIRSSLLDQLEPPFVDLQAATPTGPFSYDLAPDARRFETFESSVAGRLGLGAAVDHALTWGIDDIAARVVATGDELRSRLASVPGVTVRDPGREHCAIVTFTVAGHLPAEVAGHLMANDVTVRVSTGPLSPLDLAPRGLVDGVVRASVHYLTTSDEIDRTVDLVARLSADQRR